MSAHPTRKSGEFVPVSTIYPRAALGRRWARQLTPFSGLVCALLGGASTARTHMADYQSGKITSTQMATAVGGRMLLDGAAGAAAAYCGLFAYSTLRGSARIASGLGVAAAAGAAVHFGVPAVPQTYNAVQAHRARQEEARRLAEAQSQGAPPAAPNGNTPAEGQIMLVSNDELADRERVKKEYQFKSPPFRGPWNDSVVYVGMNKGVAPRAAQRLRRQGAQVTLIVDGAQQDIIRFQGRVYRLDQNAGISAFAKQLGLKDWQTEEITAALQACEKHARDELAQLALVWLRAEKGGVIPSRLVLAGHSNGDGVWGDGNGSLRLGPLRLLAQAMPRAARQVEDAFVTGCYSGGEVTMDQYRLILPQVKTIWAYEAQAPGVDNGGALDQAGWEAATRGRVVNVLPKNIAAKHMAVWNSKRGYVAFKPPMGVNELRGKVEWMQKNFFAPAFQGKSHTRVDNFNIPIEITDPQTGLVRQYYSWLCRLTQTRDLPPHERVTWNQRKHQTIRLIYYSSTVAPRFTEHFANDIRRGYAAMGLTPPNYANLNRGRALSQIQAYARTVKQKPNAPREARKLASILQRGLGELDPEVIPDGWV